MNLRISDIKLHDFRSYSDLNLSNLGNLTIFEGSNAIGKTNIIESISLLTSLTSFRHATAKELVRKGQDSCRIALTLTDENRKLDIALSIEEEKKRYTLNGKTKKTRELKGFAPSVTFAPEDLDLIKSSDSIRRRELDILGSQLNSNYYQITRDYDKILRHKNHLLKEESSPELIEALDELMIRVGAQLSSYRSAFFYKLLHHAARLYTDITGSSENLGGMYICSWDQAAKDLSVETMRSQMEEALLAVRVEELERGRTLIGPHKDKVFITLDDMDASKFASQGQQRSIVLAWKLAEVELIEEMLGQLPILLLDDVMSELDETRRNALVSYLSKDIQTFITTANIDYFQPEMLSKADVIHLPLQK